MSRIGQITQEQGLTNAEQSRQIYFTDLETLLTLMKSKIVFRLVFVALDLHMKHFYILCRSRRVLATRFSPCQCIPKLIFQVFQWSTQFYITNGNIKLKSGLY